MGLDWIDLINICLNLGFQIDILQLILINRLRNK